ncbi:acyl-CoA dehydrogenase family protein [Zavarzinia compransoris]|uniref:Acyl-CoA dehydrogenase n=1 Tax=Zavarzinia compransoris TaxID=1264899 RepID=A0A317E3T1_9PROT|nr:acyl-CoA dehydrogenase family protein [Zavarzinia compransoris]PWR21639.1 acyl-CoA dehydrogenase [Zavarzinia compransoris]TDP45581.1 alkylation response protein AidB-like acyl-CoA dehydrogenase [Zavarzinia compransoris]
MNFELAPEQLELQQMVRNFARAEIAPVQERMDRDHAFPLELWRKWSALGMPGILIPPEYGGSGLDSLTYILAMEEVGTVSQTFALIWQVHVMVANMYVHLGDEAQKQRWLPQFASGEKLGAFGLTEPDAGSDAGGLRTRAVRDGNDGWIINGNKIFISNAGTEISDGLVLMAVTGEKPGGGKAISCFTVPAGTPGFELGQSFDKMAWHGMDNRELVFQDCRVGNDMLLGTEGAGLKQALGGLNLGRIVFGTLGAALSRACLEVTLPYAKERKQFGQSLSSFQITQTKLADMAAHAEATRRFAHYVAWKHSRGEDVHSDAAMLKLVGTRLAGQSARDAYQIHGGYGFMHDYEVNRLYREAQILEIGEGTNEIQQLLIARALGC